MSKPAYDDDAEKGTLEVVPRAPAPELAIDEKEPVAIDVFPVQSLKKDAPVLSTITTKLPPSTSKPTRMKASRYVLFIIWYNSYRSV